jgi:CTP:molybdopterin cytidylyltransferase MocA
VLLLRPAWRWVDALEGDQGLAALLSERPDAIVEVVVAGEMPDVDSPADLDRLDSRT